MPSLVPFASARDLRLLSPGVPEDVADLVLDVVSGVIRGRSGVGWPVDEHTATYTQLVRPTRRYATAGGMRSGDFTVTLPALNVTAVTSVVVDDTTVLRLSDWDVTRSGIVHIYTAVPRKVTVTYTAGWKRAPADEAPAEFRMVALDLASRWGENPGGVSGSYTMGNVAERIDTTMVETVVSEDSRLDPYRVNLL